MRQPARMDALAALRDGALAFDLIVIGGGITGAGIAREAAAGGLRTLLVEQRDFAWGTSSRSSKMVHGGLRYLGSGQFRLTRDAVRERQRLLEEVPGLVRPLQFLMPHYRRQFPGPWLFGLLLAVYDRFAGRRSRRRLNAAETLNWVPGLRTQNLVGASGFLDAVTDDARLVQRILEEARNSGAWCLNYLKASVGPANGGKRTVTLTDTSGPQVKSFELSAPVIVNATGAWASEVDPGDGQSQRSIRPLRGSHLVLPYESLPVSCSVSLLHPEDRRPVFAFPWHGMTVLGTTDLDHPAPLDLEPRITEGELEYLLKISSTLFPGRQITRNEIVATWAGVRPVVSEGPGKAPSKENREHVIWDHQGLVNVAGGKLTTYRLIARQILEQCRPYLTHLQLPDDALPGFSPPPSADQAGGQRPNSIPHNDWRKLQGSYGPALAKVLESGEPLKIPGTDTYWCELIWAAANTDVIHLDDLMLRRTRLGLMLPNGASELLDLIEKACSAALGWDKAAWVKERERYLAIWRENYSLPSSDTTAPEAPHGAV